MQEEIVTEIETYQKIIDGAKQIVDNYKPIIWYNPECEIVTLSDIMEFNPPKSEVKHLDYAPNVSIVPMAQVSEKDMYFKPQEDRPLQDVYSGYTFFKENDVLLANVTPCFENGKSGLAKNLTNGIGFGSSEFFVLRAKACVLPEILYYIINSVNFINEGRNNMSGTGGLQRLTKDYVLNYSIALPPLETQQQIVAQINEEMGIVQHNKRLIEIFEGKIKAKINEVWGSNVVEEKYSWKRGYDLVNKAVASIANDTVQKFIDEILKDNSLQANTVFDYPDYLFKTLDYLPKLFQHKNEEKYIDSLFSAMKISYANNLFQFAYILHHMIFMIVIYYVLLKISWLYADEFHNAIYYITKDRCSEFYSSSNTKEEKLYFGSFAAINESDVFMLLKIIGMDNNLEGELKKFIKERNKYAHANGSLLLTSESLFQEKIIDCCNQIDKVYLLLKPNILKLYKQTLLDEDFNNSEIKGYPGPEIQIQEEFIKKFSLSSVELNWCRKYKINDLSESNNFAEIKELHIALCNYYKILFDGDDEV